MLHVHPPQRGADAPVEIAGAGPAGLAAAIMLARAGQRVLVHEAQCEVGHRFQRDLQGLENWSTEQDALEALRALGLTADFRAVPCARGTAYDAWERPYEIRSEAPLCYVVERGPGPESLDSSLLRQAQQLGIDVRFNSRMRPEDAAIVATGPRAAHAISVGYHFDTDMQDGFWVICNDQLAPKGYAYLLTMQGRGTVKSCMFDDFRRQGIYVERTVFAFQKLAGLSMRNERPHGGAAHFAIPDSAGSDGQAHVGEQAGFQDGLWGFGLRVAIGSGALAARSIVTGESYESLWRRLLRPQLRASLVNRAAYARLGNLGYRALLLGRLAKSSDPRRMLNRLYEPSWLHRALFPLTRNGIPIEDEG